jgi:hypothetical protein
MFACPVELFHYDGTGVALDVDLVLPTRVSGHLVSTYFAVAPPPLVVSARLTSGVRVPPLVGFGGGGYLDAESRRFVETDPQAGELAAFDYARDRRPRAFPRLSPADRQFLADAVARMMVGG